MADYFFEFEKRKHYYKLAGNLLASYQRGKSINKGLLKKVKENLHLWVGDPNLVQVYARFLNEIEKEGVSGLGKAVGIVPLVNLYRTIGRKLKDSTNKPEELKRYISGLDACEMCTRGLEGRDFFECLLQNTDFFSATHVANLFFNEEFLPLTEELAGKLGIDEGNYLEVIKPLKGADLRKLFASLYALLEEEPVKINHVKRLLGMSRERELLARVADAWNAEDFWRAHELLEEVWALFKNEETKRCYRALIRASLALHKLKEGQRESALEVLKKALLDMAECSDTFRGINLGEIREYLEEVLATKELGNPPEFKYNIKSEAA
ncbi:MAG: DUF309 domain-containing protein [Aquificae bacterium]|nr:DUF309 domain-containing protein [Aquificota bacterium]